MVAGEILVGKPSHQWVLKNKFVKEILLRMMGGRCVSLRTTLSVVSISKEMVWSNQCFEFFVKQIITHPETSNSDGRDVQIGRFSDQPKINEPGF